MSDIDDYFEMIEEKRKEAYEVAGEARSQHRDPEPEVDIPVAEDLAAKAVSLISGAMYPELRDYPIPERIRELEEEYTKNDERVALEIGREIAENEFHEFEDDVDRIDAGLRVGLSYMTGGITTAPLEGIADTEIKENDDGSRYLAVYYAGPIRSAGGTASALSVLVADYIRKNVGLDRYKPRDEEIDRYAVEVEDYFTRVTKKQYTPERKETRFIAENVPVEVTGSPTEQLDVSNHKDLERIDTNRIRGGMCLIYLDGLPLKASKIRKRIDSYGEEFGLQHWDWVDEYLDLQHEIHSSGDEEDHEDEEDAEKEYEPSDKFLGSLTAGRPVFAHPGKKGGFRLRYGRSRTGGLAAVNFHPATMEVTDRFMAIGTQLKVEYPGKGTVSVPCDAIDGPIVRLDDGEVRQLETREEAAEVTDRVDEILFLGDMLVPYGEFVENGKELLPSPYVEEWWAQEVEAAPDDDKDDLETDLDRYIKRPFETPDFETAMTIAEELDVPLHPDHIYLWHDIDANLLEELYDAVADGTFEGENLVIDAEAKDALEELFIPHTVEDDGEVLALHGDVAAAVHASLDPDETDIEDFEDVPEGIEKALGVPIRDVGSIFLGGRMGRPEKAERRFLKGKPQLLFPCGKDEGGRMRNLIRSYNEHGTVNEQIIHNHCPSCDRDVHFSYCPYCDEPTEEMQYCSSCGKRTEEDTCPNCGDETSRKKYTDIPLKELLDIAQRNTDVDELPDLLKSPRAVTGKHRHVEPLEKGLLRGKHDLYVNKDGTVRYDSTDLTMTHFKPKEINVSPEKLRELGYEEDIHGEPLEADDQVLELKPQDIVISENDMNYSATECMYRSSRFVDDLLEQFYDLEEFYGFEDPQDVVGELVIGLAPHTSGGIIGRIIGFTEAKGTYAHPYWHAAKRRNCLPGDTGVRLADGSEVTLADLYRDADGEAIADDVGTREKEIDVPVISVDGREVTEQDAVKVYRTPAQEFTIELETESGRTMTVFPDHRVRTADGVKRARMLEEGDRLLTPRTVDVTVDDIETIDLLEQFENRSDVMVRLEESLDKMIKDKGGLSEAAAQGGVSSKQMDNYRRRGSAPLAVLEDLGTDFEGLEGSRLAAKYDNVEIPAQLTVDDAFMRLIGLYLAEGYMRKSEEEGEQFYQVCFAYGEEELRDLIVENIEEVFGISPTVEENTVTLSSRLVFEVFNGLGVGQDAHTKSIPDQFKGLPQEKVASMLAGYFAGGGAVEAGRLHVTADSVSRSLLEDIDFLLKRFGIFTRIKTRERKASGILVEKYGKQHYADQTFTSHRLHVRSTHAVKFCEQIGFALTRKQQALERDKAKEGASREKIEGEMVLDPITSITVEKSEDQYMYDIEVQDTHTFLTEGNLVSNNCDGDEDSIILLMDALLNFSRQFLPDQRGTRTMDAPLILSTVLNPDEVDDESWNVDVQGQYPVEFYEASQEFADPGDVDVEIAEDRIERDEPFNLEYTHPSSDVEDAPIQSSYVTLGEMAEKVQVQLDLGRKTKAVEANEVAELLLQKHFITDIKGNLRAFSRQQLRCVDCNEKYRRAPLAGECTSCGGRLLLTVSEGTIRKYLEPSEEIADNFAISTYRRQHIYKLKRQIQSLFGKANKQSSLGQFTSD